MVYGILKLLVYFLLSVFVAALSSIIPSYWAATKDPIEAIYHR